MKHLLNNLSEEEKNSIREQHEGGMKLDTSRFRTLLENKSGNVKPLVENEEEEDFGFASHSGDFEGDDSEDEGYEEEPNEEIFSFRRIRLAPAVVLLGFGITIYSILKTKNK